jgi:fructokinase
MPSPPQPSTPRQRVIVSIGESVMCEYPDRTEPGGLALAAALAAVAANQRGVCISRVGQDATGENLMQQARAAGMDVAQVQSDPDLPTGRLVTRMIAGRMTTTLTANAAFDNLQWDFDMVDVAQHADAVFFGHLARRNGQSRSVIKQFLAECSASLRVFDLTNRATESLDRGEAMSGLEFCDVVVADARALHTLAPTAGDAGAAAAELVRSEQLQAVLVCDREGDAEHWSAVTANGAGGASSPIAGRRHYAALVQAAIEILEGKDVGEMVRGIGATE